MQIVCVGGRAHGQRCSLGRHTVADDVSAALLDGAEQRGPAH